MPYIHFTEEQKLRASSVDLVEFLRRQGEKLIRSGPEYRMASDHSVTVRGNGWYDHASKEGGGPISFAQNYFGLSYPEAVTCLLDGEQGQVYETVQRKKEEPQKEFIQPPAGREMRRLYAYLLKKRLIDREVLNTFVRAGLVYEDENYHNAVFIGKDEHGIVRHAHKRSTNDIGKSFRINVEGSDPRYSFHWFGTSDRLYVFEAPIDLLSFLTLYPKNWQQHSYVAVCGVGEQAMLWMLEQAPNMRRPILCLDHDSAGIEANGRLTEILAGKGYKEAVVLQSICKDWNEDVKARCGLEAQSAEEHPQLLAAPEICGRIVTHSGTAKLDRLKYEVPWLIEQYRAHLHWGHFDRAMDCMEQASVLSLTAYRRELQQMGRPVGDEELDEVMCGRFHPHRNCGALKNRYRELSAQFQSILSLEKAPGPRTREAKAALADRWLELALSFAGVPIQYEAKQMEQQPRQKQGLGLG